MTGEGLRQIAATTWQPSRSYMVWVWVDCHDDLAAVSQRHGLGAFRLLCQPGIRLAMTREKIVFYSKVSYTH